MQEPMNRIGDLLKTCQARISLGTVQAVAVVSLFVLALLALLIVPPNGESASSKSDLFPSRALTSIEIQRIEAALGQAQLANYEVKAGSICVPQALRGAYLFAIAEAGGASGVFSHTHGSGHCQRKHNGNIASAIATAAPRLRETSHPGNPRIAWGPGCLRTH